MPAHVHPRSCFTQMETPHRPNHSASLASVLLFTSSHAPVYRRYDHRTERSSCRRSCCRASHTSDTSYPGRGRVRGRCRGTFDSSSGQAVSGCPVVDPVDRARIRSGQGSRTGGADKTRNEARISAGGAVLGVTVRRCEFGTFFRCCAKLSLTAVGDCQALLQRNSHLLHPAGKHRPLFRPFATRD